MGCVYRYTDLNDGIIKYVGIVYSDSRTLAQRIAEHKREGWFKTSKWKIEYTEDNIATRTDAEYLEAHYIALYGTDKWFNKAKAGWGVSSFIQERNDWTLFDPHPREQPLPVTVKPIQRIKKEKPHKQNNLRNSRRDKIAEKISHAGFENVQRKVIQEGYDSLSTQERRIITYIINKMANDPCEGCVFYLDEICVNCELRHDFDVIDVLSYWCRHEIPMIIEGERFWSMVHWVEHLCCFEDGAVIIYLNIESLLPLSCIPDFHLTSENIYKSNREWKAAYEWDAAHQIKRTTMNERLEAILNDGCDIDMSKISRCRSTSLDWCEHHCHVYHHCLAVRSAECILAEYNELKSPQEKYINQHIKILERFVRRAGVWRQLPETQIDANDKMRIANAMRHNGMECYDEYIPSREEYDRAVATLNTLKAALP